MASIAENPAPRARSIAPDRFERVLAVLSLVLLAAVLAAIARGYPQWNRVPGAVWPHLIALTIALALTPAMLLRRRGDRPHRLLGTIWVAAMLVGALSSFRLGFINPGGFSVIHLLSIYTLIQVPILYWAAKTHRVALHRRGVRGLVLAALLVAGFFTFGFNRLLGQWLFG